MSESKSISEGPWRLEFLILEKQIDLLLYLTSNGVGKEVTIEPWNEPIKQIWFLIPVEGKKDYYKIIQDPMSNCPPGLKRVEGSNKVILSEQPDEWHFQYVPIDRDDSDISNGDVFKIHTPSPFNIVQLLGKEQQEAVIQTFPILPIFKGPAWRFRVLIPK